MHILQIHSNNIHETPLTYGAYAIIRQNLLSSDEFVIDPRKQLGHLRVDRVKDATTLNC